MLAVWRASEPTLLDMLTILGEADRRSSGSSALVTRIAPMTLVSTTVCSCSRRHLGGLLRHSSGHTGVVDQHVEPAGALLDECSGSGHTGVLGDIQRYAERIDPLPVTSGRSLAASFVTGADADAPAEGAEAGRDLVPDPLVGARYQGDLLLIVVCSVTPRSSADPDGGPGPVG